MRDQMNLNALSVIGTPSLVSGALTVDTDQALSLVGPTSSALAFDSPSLSITGSFSIELFLWLSSLPGSTKDVVRKTGSYAVQVDSSGHVLFALNGSVVATSNVVLQTNRWYHLVCVYNANYAGVAQFGKTSLGSSNLLLADGDGDNKCVTQFTLTEPALLKDVNLSLQYNDELWPVQMCGVVYADNAGAPGALVTKSDMQTLNVPIPQWRVPTWVRFPVTPAVVPAGDYHIGMIADTVAGPFPKLVMQVGREATGGVTSRRNDSVSGPSDPFGTPSVVTTEMLAAYCNYTAISRTGFEGKAVIYINGARNVSASYSAGIADTTNPLEVCPALTAQIDELSIWNKPLTSVQVATHYTAH